MSLPGSDDLQKVRSDFANQLDTAQMPTTRDELWRYSRIDNLNWSRFSPLDGEDVKNLRKENLPGAGPAAFDIGEHSALVVFHNGVITHVDIDEKVNTSDINIYDALCPGAYYRDNASSLRIDYGIDTKYSYMELLRNAFSISKCVIDISDEVVLNKPIVVVHWVDAKEKAVFPILEVNAGVSSEVTVVERLESLDDVSALAIPATYLKSGENANINYVQAQQYGNKTWSIHRLETFVEQNANCSLSSIAMGGYYARSRIITNLMGEASHADIQTVYAGSDSQMLDFRTNQNHYGNNSTSNLDFKGSVIDSSDSVYSGLIYIDNDATGCNAHQSNRALILSDCAAAHSVPNLEINNDDVQCSHASAVGEVDAEQLYYLALRGFTPLEAKQLIVAGFFEDILNKFPISGLVESVRQEVIRKVSS